MLVMFIVVVLCMQNADDLIPDFQCPHLLIYCWKWLTPVVAKLSI